MPHYFPKMERRAKHEVEEATASFRALDCDTPSTACYVLPILVIRDKTH